MRIARRLQDQRGALLLEALVAVSVFTLLGTAVMTGLSATGSAAEGIEVSSTAENLAANQLETILASPYQDPPHTYAALTPPPGYTVTAEALELVPGDSNIANLVVTVFRDGSQVLLLESARLKDLQ